MSDEWRNDYDAFRKWSLENGYDPLKCKYQCTIERVDNDVGYFPENCKWVSQKVQCNNRSNNHYIEYDGQRHTISQWAEITGIRKDTLRRRIVNYGWSVERALTENTHKYHIA